MVEQTTGRPGDQRAALNPTKPTHADATVESGTKITSEVAGSSKVPAPDAPQKGGWVRSLLRWSKISAAAVAIGTNASAAYGAMVGTIFPAVREGWKWLISFIPTGS